MVGAGAGIAAGVISMGIELSAAKTVASVRYMKMRKKVPIQSANRVGKDNQYGTFTRNAP